MNWLLFLLMLICASLTVALVGIVAAVVIEHIEAKRIGKSGYRYQILRRDMADAKKKGNVI